MHFKQVWNMLLYILMFDDYEPNILFPTFPRIAWISKPGQHTLKTNRFSLQSDSYTSLSNENKSLYTLSLTTCCCFYELNFNQV